MEEPVTSEGVKITFPGYSLNSPMSKVDFSRTELNDDDQFLVESPLGTMKMRQWVFEGIRMGFTDWSFKKPVTFKWEGSLDAVTMYYCLKGPLSIDDHSGNIITFGSNQHNSHYSESFSGLMKMDSTPMKSFMLQIHKEMFLRIASGGNDSLKYFADQVASGKPSNFSEKNLPIDIDTLHVIHSIRDCKFSPPLKKIFFLSKALELLVLQADAHARSLQKSIACVRSDYDRDRIVFAKDYMMQHIDTPPTIPELAKIAGINEFKLKKGYKEIFGHLAEARLQLARQALSESRKPVSEIASELGYSSVQHFCTAFRKRFGITPKGARSAH